MSDDQNGAPRPDDETQPVRPEGAATPSPEPADPADPVARRGFRERFRSLRRPGGRDRTFGLAALIASALAGVIIGSLGLTAVHAITHDGPGDRFDRGGWVQRQDGSDEGPGGGFDGRGGRHGAPPGMPGQVPPTTPPQDEGSNG
jgi:hypothetical protein